MTAGVVPKCPAFRDHLHDLRRKRQYLFRYLEEKHQVPSFVLDIPDEYSEDAENYVVEQLKELIGVLEERTGRKLDPEELKRTLERENEV